MEKFFLSIVFILPTYITAIAQNVHIPDTNFKSELVSNTAININGDGEIQVSEAGIFNGTINVAGESIHDLTGIEAFTALTILDCRFNYLTTLDLSANTALTHLYCWNNWLTSLDVSANTNLVRFECPNNSLTSLDLSNNLDLSVLHCGGNELTSLNVSANTNLTELYCGLNNLTTLDVTSNTALTTLYCNLNNLTSLDVSANTALEVLKCSGNHLNNLDVSANVALTDLDCSDNHLPGLNLSTNAALTELHCSSNMIPSLNVSGNTALTLLSCSQNQLSSLDVAANTALYWLECGYNQITSLDVSANPELARLFCDNNRMTSLNMQNGNNTNISNYYILNFYAKNNPDLTCIQVDDVLYSDTMWINTIDATASFSENCSAVSIADLSDDDNMTIYPNPSSGIFTVRLYSGRDTKICVYDMWGNCLWNKSGQTNTSSTIDLTDQSKGIYFLEILTDGERAIRKIVMK